MKFGKIILFFSTIFFSGCGTINFDFFNTPSMERIVNFVKSGTIFAVHNVLINNPQYKPIFSVVSNAFKNFQNGFNHSPEELKKIINEELEKRGLSDYDDFVFESFSSILLSYEKFYNMNIKNDFLYNKKIISDFVKAVEKGIKEGEQSAKDGEMLYGSNPLDDLSETFFLVE